LDAERLEALRSAHQADGVRRSKRHSVRVEDYLEVLHELELVEGRAKPARIAESLVVARPSVTKMLQRLDEEGLVEYKRYHGAVLTREGRLAAESLRERHSLLVRFLIVLGVDEETAHIDTEGIEHHFHEKTLDALRRLVEKAETDPGWWESRNR
jgi:DtxR family manganese transport transcriptional regulator